MSDFFKFPRKSEFWLECSICGLDYPFSQMQKHYKTKKYVDQKCADDFGRVDLLADWDFRPSDNETFTPQKVDQTGGAMDPDFSSIDFSSEDFNT